MAHNTLLYTRTGKEKSSDPCSQENVSHSNATDKCLSCFRDGEMTQLINCLPCTHEEDLSSMSQTHVKMLDVMARPSTREVETGGSLGFDGQPVLPTQQTPGQPETLSQKGVTEDGSLRL